MADDSAGSDGRCAWLRSVLLSSLRCADAKLDRLLAGEESLEAVRAFFDDARPSRLLVYEAPKGELATASVRRAAADAPRAIRRAPWRRGLAAAARPAGGRVVAAYPVTGA